MNFAPQDWQRDWPAPAKLNLFLHVVGRRANGYHLLQTLFRLLDFGDTLRFAPRADSAIVLATPLPGVPPEADLTVRAARLLQAESGTRQGVTIHVRKRIPTGGGLGGGSSDAATTLLALNRLWQLGFSRPRLQVLGLALGADVPVFVAGQNAFAEGVGEELTPVVLPPASYLILKPPVSVPTAAIFSAPDLCRDTPLMRRVEWTPDFAGHNDLEPVACRLYPEVAEALDWLRTQTRPAPQPSRCRMTGSGACLFAEFTTPEGKRRAEEIVQKIPAGWQGWVAAGL
ncbi:MAG: 4-(cytidine 5'-diphospho)-2-C-methyl-D-erythritol kinase [Zoogloeaceae bacterium]|jgi:4-diphosphocytidyl-2-C-methyl-D-erythritol kinase|nr:4-(cytidine 5'-diphospho)-2-C-methyl-D-erythritol kinase [Zoogloeaceae bacterium]